MYDASEYHDLHYSESGEGPEIVAALEFLGRHAELGSRLLDYGCGNGDFLRAAAARGYAGQGVEQGETSIVQAAAKSGAPVAPLEDVEASGNRFDIIHMADVLEHLPDPRTTLRRLEHLLAPGGRFFFEGPLERQRSLVYWFAASTKWSRRLLGDRRAGSLPPTHLTSTNWASQRYFFETVMGYRVLDSHLWETGWPYVTAAVAPASLGAKVRRAIGAVAVGAARTSLGRRLGLANRFRVLAEPLARHVDRSASVS